MVAGTSQRERHVPRTRDKTENKGLWELTAGICASSVDLGRKVEVWMRRECGLAEEWEMKLGEVNRDQIIKGLNGFIKEVGLYPKVKREPPRSFKQGHVMRFNQQLPPGFFS